mmetsp:Transcript_37415/g.93472  ORF Transcript_37415/g.93472 Transcript_37415/m.93472 type:complete len:239 (+) Transcript_37415:451-1167(+)
MLEWVAHAPLAFALVIRGAPTGAHVLQGRNVEPHGANVVRVGVHVNRQGKLHLGPVGHVDVGVPQLLDEGRDVGVGIVDREADEMIRLPDSLEHNIVLGLRERLDATRILLVPLEQRLELVPHRAVPVGDPVTAQVLKLASELVLHRTLDAGAVLVGRALEAEARVLHRVDDLRLLEATCAKEGPPALGIVQIPAQLVCLLKGLHVGPHVRVVEDAADRGERASLVVHAVNLARLCVP